MKNRIIALILALALTLGLTACGDTAAKNPDPTPTPTPAATPEPTPAPTPEPVTVRFGALSGPTGVGAVKLMADAAQGKTALDYDVTVAAENTEITGKLINGDLDIACVASNMGANLYNKTGGGIQALCLSTLGVLYILERGGETTVSTMADLKGKTIYATGQGANPQYVLEYLLRQNGVDPAADVNIVWQTAQEVQANLLSGNAQYAMLPVPAATAAQIQGKANGVTIRSALDLTGEWNKVSDGSVLTMTTVVVRTEFAEEHPEVVETFLKEYAASIQYVNSNVEEASLLVEQFGIVPKAAIAKQAIPACNLVYIDGKEMQEQITGYYQVLYDADPASVGGKVPGADFYYGVN